MGVPVQCPKCNSFDTADYGHITRDEERKAKHKGIASKAVLMRGCENCKYNWVVNK